ERAEPVVTPACDAGAIGVGQRRCKLRGIAGGRRSIGHTGTPNRAEIVRTSGRAVCQRVLPLLEAGAKADVAGSPDRVTGCLSECVGAMAAVPEIAADLPRRSRRRVPNADFPFLLQTSSAFLRRIVLAPDDGQAV